MPITYGHVALGTKRQPLATRALAAPKLNHSVNTNLLGVLGLDLLQLLLCLLVVKALMVKLRIKATFLSLKVRHLPFQICKLVLSKGKLLIEQGRGAVLGN